MQWFYIILSAVVTFLVFLALFGICIWIWRCRKDKQMYQHELELKRKENVFQQKLKMVHADSDHDISGSAVTMSQEPNMGFDTPDFSTAEIPKHSGIYQYYAPLSYTPTDYDDRPVRDFNSNKDFPTYKDNITIENKHYNETALKSSRRDNVNLHQESVNGNVDERYSYYEFVSTSGDVDHTEDNTKVYAQSYSEIERYKYVAPQNRIINISEDAPPIPTRRYQQSKKSPPQNNYHQLPWLANPVTNDGGAFR